MERGNGSGLELKTVKEYIRVDYSDDDEILWIMHDAVIDEMKELIPTFDEKNITNRQKLLILTYIKELYDDRDQMTEGDQDVRYAVRSMMLKEMLR